MIGRTVAWAAAAMLQMSFTVEAVAQDATAGANVFKRCAICHSVTPGKGSTIGPNLKGVVGRKAGSVAGYRYSPAMAKSAIKWDSKTLDAYFAKPAAVVPGTKMAYGGLPNAKDRADLIAYLASQK